MRNNPSCLQNLKFEFQFNFNPEKSHLRKSSVTAIPKVDSQDAKSDSYPPSVSSQRSGRLKKVYSPCWRPKPFKRLCLSDDRSSAASEPILSTSTRYPLVKMQRGYSDLDRDRRITLFQGMIHPGSIAHKNFILSSRRAPLHPR